jgi:hypothetical protein
MQVVQPRLGGFKRCGDREADNDVGGKFDEYQM